jgi:superfamily I DNA and RNA helicase
MKYFLSFSNVLRRKISSRVKSTFYEVTEKQTKKYKGGFCDSFSEVAQRFQTASQKRMHILPHKSWNPYSLKNIAKVQRDEREHAIAEQKKRKRQREIVQSKFSKLHFHSNF